MDVRCPVGSRTRAGRDLSAHPPSVCSPRAPTYYVAGEPVNPTTPLTRPLWEEWHGRQHLLGLLGIDGPAMDSDRSQQ